MNALLSYLNKYANLRNALTVTLFLFWVVVPINNRMTAELYQLTNGVDKLDFHRTYDTTLVSQIFDAYGRQGRTLYAWDLIVDTFYPLAVALSTIFFALTVVRKPILQKLLIVIPMIFLITDVIENAFLVLFLGTYPSLSPTLVTLSSFFTSAKLSTIYPTFYEMFLFMPIAILMAVLSFARKLWIAIKISGQR